jgi:beta-galactosidase
MAIAARSFLAICALALAGVAQAQPVDQAAVRTVQLLANDWKFVQSDDLTDEAAVAATASDWQTVSLPHTWNAEDAATPNFERYKRGVGWYRLELMRPAVGVRHWLEFGAASLVADVWLNGSKIGEHDGGYTAFRFDITDELLAGVPNVLLVKVDNSIPQENDDDTAIAPLGGDFNKSGGLYRYVALISTPSEAHFALGDFGGPGVYASTSAIAAGSAQMNVRTKLENDSALPGDFVVRVSLTDAEGGLAASSEQPVALPVGQTTELDLPLAVVNPHLWNGRADPYLYKLVADLVRGDGTVADRIVQSFGIREMRFDAELGFFLNGQHIGRLNGVAMHQDFAGKGYAVSEPDVEQSLALIVEIGANAVRLGHYPFSAYTLRRLDELGLVAWAERPSGVRTTVDKCERIDVTQEALANVRQQLVELIRQQYNHASVALWSVGNETSFGQVGCDNPYDNVTPVLRELHALAKSEDPTRPTVYAEFPHSARRNGPFATEGITDLFATNRYFLWYHEPIEAFSPLLDDLHALAAGQPLAVSEYGGGSAIAHHTDDPTGGLPEVHSAEDDTVSSYQPEEYASYLHEQNYRVIASKPYLWGSFAWNMFDFGSTNRNEGGVLGINTKGLVTFDRQTRKDPFYFYKANWSNEPVTYITSRRYTERAYAVADVKVYSNADSVELGVNGVPVASLTGDRCEQRTCVFEAVRLAQGANTVVATGNHAGTAVVDTVSWSVGTDAVNIAAGRLETGYESSGVRFGSDTFFVGGTADHVGGGDAEGGTPDLRGADDPQLYKYFRRGEFSYEIPLADGSYSFTLSFMEPDEDIGDGGRVFAVVANGHSLLENFDVRREAGAVHTSVTKTFVGQVSGGRLVLDFEPMVGEAILSNIRVAPR